MRRQSSRIATFLQADARPMFCWPRSASTTQSQVWLGLPDGRFQSGGSPRITAATARWCSSCGELRAICPKSRISANVCQWPDGREDGIRWLLWLPHLSHGESMVSSESCVVPTCQMHQCESTGSLLWTMFRTHTTRQGLCKSGRGVFWYPVWCLTSRFFFPASSCRIELCQSDAGSHLCCHQRSRSCYPAE